MPKALLKQRQRIRLDAAITVSWWGKCHTLCPVPTESRISPSEGERQGLGGKKGDPYFNILPSCRTAWGPENQGPLQVFPGTKSLVPGTTA
jgi:hypothetical protein